MARSISVRRRSRSGLRSITAASQRITQPSKAFSASIVGGAPGTDAWQELAWEYVRRVGELSYYVNWRSAAAGRCRLVASDVDPITRIPTGSTENAAVAEIVRDIGGDAAGQSAMVARMTALLTVPGEGYFAMLVRDPARERTAAQTETTPGTNGVPEAGVEQWFTVSRDEIRKGTARPDAIEIILPDGVVHTFDPETEMLFRTWNPDLRKASEPTSPIRANLDTLNEIVRTTATIENASKSRLLGNGVMFVPQEMSLPSQTAPVAEPITGGSPTIPPVSAPAAQQLQDLLYEIATTSLKDQNSMAAYLPVIASAPGEWIKNVSHLTFDSKISEMALLTREKSMQRLARGLDVSPERLLGLGGSNHWSAWQIDDSDLKVHIAPPVEVICAALTNAVLREALEELGLDPDLYVIWYDATELVQDPDRADDAKDAYDRGAITAEALRRYNGFSEKDAYALDTQEGWEQLARDRAAQDVSVIPKLAALLGAPAASVTDDVPALEKSPAQRDTDEDEYVPVEGEPPPEEEPTPKPPPRKLSADESRTTTTALARICVGRALELAAKRRRTRANHAAYQGLSNLHNVHSRLPSMTRDDALAAIEGWDSTLDDDTLDACGVAPDTFRHTVVETTVKALTHQGT